MTATQPKWENAVSIGEMSFYGDVRYPKPARHTKPCPCGAILSRYNHGDMCIPCHDRTSALCGPVTPHPPTKGDIQNTRQLDAALDAARALSAVFTSGDLARSLGVEPNAANAVLRRLVSRGDISSLGKAVPTGRALKGRDSRRPVLMWSCEAGEDS